MALPTFTKTDNSYTPLTFTRGRTLDSGGEYVPNQSITKSGGGKVQVCDMGGAERYLTVNFQSLTTTIYTQLVNFLKDDTVRWSGKTFTFTDENAVAYTGRWWGDKLPENPTKNQDIDVTMLFRIEI